jgi:hypothetical protein
MCLVAATVALASCQWRRLTFNDPIRPDDVAFIRPGQTTLVEVVAKLGPPDEIVPAGETLIARYRFQDGKYIKLDLGRLMQFWLPFAPELSMARAQLDTDVFQVVLDAHGRVREHAFALVSPATRFNPWPF